KGLARVPRSASRHTRRSSRGATMIRPSRSALFVPGNRAAWIEKAAGYGADTLILDLEDSVPDQEKAPARAIVKAGLKALKAMGQVAGVRVNGFATGLTLDDLEGILCPE